MPTASATKRAVLYARISEDASGEAAGVHRQLGDARQLAVLREWQVVEECQDNDVSALNGAYRPGYERVLHLVRQGAVDHVVVWQTSRLLRNRRERAEAIELFGRQRVGIITVKGQDLDLSKAYGRGMAGLLGEFDTMESEVKSERVAAAALQRAEKGDPNGAIPFGWSRVIETSDRGVRTGARDVRDPDTAPVVREVCARLLAGETLRGVTE